MYCNKEFINFKVYQNEEKNRFINYCRVVFFICQYSLQIKLDEEKKI